MSQFHISWLVKNLSPYTQGWKQHVILTYLFKINWLIKMCGGLSLQHYIKLMFSILLPQQMDRQTSLCSVTLTYHEAL